jgi:hypothetical protein
MAPLQGIWTGGVRRGGGEVRAWKPAASCQRGELMRWVGMRMTSILKDLHPLGNAGSLNTKLRIDHFEKLAPGLFKTV